MAADDQPDTRASDLERERTIDVLREAAGEGRLTFEELADRIEDAAGSRTRGELDELTGDLPAAGVADAPLSEIAAPAAQSSFFGDLRRSGVWVVPVRSGWRTCFGDVKLDLREARVGGGDVTIEADTVFGDVELLVPEGIAVEIRCTTILGDVRQDAGGQAPPGAPRVILSGRTVFGNVRVCSQRLRERIADRLFGAHVIE